MSFLTQMLPGMKPGAPSEVAGALNSIALVDSYDTSMTVDGPMLAVFLKSGQSFSLPIPAAAYQPIHDDLKEIMTVRKFIDSLPVLCKFYSMMS